jgi:leucine dehydrogenase
MQLFEYMQAHSHEEVAFWYEEQVGLKAIIAIHDTTLGPALGGIRTWPYCSEEDALLDVLRLSEGMTYKAAIAGLNIGGGKAVIIGDPTREKREALFRSFGRFVNSLNGRYITAEDVGTTVKDMVQIHRETCFVTGLPRSTGGSGDPSPLTALGVYQGMRACCQACFDSKSLQGRTVAVQGVGKVGAILVRHLTQVGARVVACDVSRQAAEKIRCDPGVELVEPDQIFEVECDVFAPCALGAVINDETIPKLRCAIIAGCANNQLAELRHGNELHRRGILYAPDYVINAGGLINVASEVSDYDDYEARRRTIAIYDTARRVIDLSRVERVPTHVAAWQLATARLKGHQRGPSRSGSIGIWPPSKSERLRKAT